MKNWGEIKQLFLGRLAVRLESQAATLAKRRPRSQTVRQHSLPSLLPATFISWWAELRKEEFASVPPTLACQVDPERVSQRESLVQPLRVLVWGPGVCGGVLVSGLPGEGSFPLPRHTGSWPTAHARKHCQNGEERPKADHTLHKTDPSLPPSPVPEADARPRPTQGPVCPGLSYPAPSSLLPSMPSTSAEGHCVLTGGAFWGLGLGLRTGGKGQARTWHHAKAHPRQPFPSSLHLCPPTCE